MKKFLILLLAFVLCFTGCGGADEPVNSGSEEISENPGSEAVPDIAGEIFNAGNVCALVPEGWMGFPVADVFAEEADAKDPDVIQICKDAASDWDIFTNPYVQINYYGPEIEFFAPGTDWYTDVEEIKPFKAGSHEWEGFTGYSDEYVFAMLWCIEGDIEYQATMWLNGESLSINYNDEDVLAILASVAPSDGSVPVGGTASENEGGSSENEILARYLGDWNGVLKIRGCSAAYSHLENVVSYACARIVIDNNGNLVPFIGFALDGVYLTSAEATLNTGSESIFINGTYNTGNYSNVEILEYMPGTIGMTFPVDMNGEGFELVVNLRRIGDENWTTEDPKMSSSDLDYFRGWNFEQLAKGMGYDSNGYPPASYLENGPAPSVPSGSSGGGNTELGEKAGADGIVADYEALKTGLEWCKTERTYDSTYDEVAAQFGVHGFFVDEYEAFDKPFRRYRWFFDDSNYVTVTFEVKPDGSETWNVTAWEGIKD